MTKLVKISQSATTLQDHLRELALRIGASLITMIIAGLVVYAFYEPILTLLRSPLDAPLYYNNPTGSFSFILKVCFIGALTISIPVLIYNLIMFIRPAFEKSIPLKMVYKTSFASSLLAIMGATFAFIIIIPGSLNFFAGFQVSGLNALISADSYLGFVTNIIITFVIMFQLPLIIAFIDTVKPLPPKKLLKFEKWVVLGSLVIALFAPFTYDFLTSLLIAVPIIVLYNLSIILVAIRHIKVARKASVPTVRKIIVTPTTTFDLILSDLAFEDMAYELTNFEKPNTISPPKPILTFVTSPKTICMDIKPANIKPEVVKPANWVVEKRLRKTAVSLGSNVNVFSDIRHIPRINRASA